MSKRTLYVLLLLLAASCSAATAPPPPTWRPHPAIVTLPAAAPSPAPLAAPTAPVEPLPKPTERVLWAQSVDLDGDGVAEPLRLVTFEVFDGTVQVDDVDENLPLGACVNDRGDDCLVTLEVGRHRQPIRLQPGYFSGLLVQVVDIDRRDGRQELLVRRQAGASEDPPYIFAVARYDGQALDWQELWHGWGYNAGTVTIAGDGRLVTAYDECPDVVTVDYGLGATGLVERGKQKVRTRQPQDCAACPVVYVQERDGLGRRGEILRNLNGPARARSQSLELALPAHFVVSRPGGSRVVVELREEKQETTYVDAITLEVDGVHYAPSGCRGGLSHCLADGVHHVLSQGESLPLTFETAAWRPGATIRLWAQGYYVPEP